MRYIVLLKVLTNRGYDGYEEETVGGWIANSSEELAILMKTVVEEEKSKVEEDLVYQRIERPNWDFYTLVVVRQEGSKVSEYLREKRGQRKEEEKENEEEKLLLLNRKRFRGIESIL